MRQSENSGPRKAGDLRQLHYRPRNSREEGAGEGRKEGRKAGEGWMTAMTALNLSAGRIRARVVSMPPTANKRRATCRWTLIFRARVYPRVRTRVYPAYHKYFNTSSENAPQISRGTGPFQPSAGGGRAVCVH